MKLIFPLHYKHLHLILGLYEETSNKGPTLVKISLKESRKNLMDINGMVKIIT